VAQDTSLLHRTLRDNIMYGHPDATETEMMRAVRAAESADFIESLRDHKGNAGLDAWVGARGMWAFRAASASVSPFHGSC